MGLVGRVGQCAHRRRRAGPLPSQHLSAGSIAKPAPIIPVALACVPWPGPRRRSTVRRRQDHKNPDDVVRLLTDVSQTVFEDDLYGSTSMVKHRPQIIKTHRTSAVFSQTFSRPRFEAWTLMSKPQSLSLTIVLHIAQYGTQLSFSCASVLSSL